MNIENEFLPKYVTQTLPHLTEKENEEYQSIKEQIIQLSLNDRNLDLNDEKIKELLNNSNNSPNIQDKLFLDINGYGKIHNLLHDDNLEEIMVIGPNKPVYVYHRTKGMMITDILIKESEIKQIIEKIATQIQRKIDKQTPILDARLPDGSRVNATIPPITPDGSTLTIRKFKKEPYTIFDLIKSKTLNTHLASFLWIVIEGLRIRPSNLIISGGTSSGKTTTLNTLTSFIPPFERIITIEDTLELQLPHSHLIRTETRPPNIENKGEVTMDLLLKNSLRQRPDRIIVGEVRSKEAITLFAALNTGHSGMGTLHANSTKETITRLMNEPMNVPNIMINSIDFIIMQKRIYVPNKGTIRRITEVDEIVGMEMDNLQLNKIYQYNPSKDELEYTAISCNAIDQIARMKGISHKQIIKEFERRKKYLEENMQNDLNISEVQRIINNYYKCDDN
ncbi:MAG: CpaF family protein [Methanosphaera stadtmanae]|nr:CpaF family protein [Methanosphaera stadtmanae]